MQIVNFFLSRPSVYTLPGTWEKQPLIKHGNYPGLPPEGQIVVIILALLLLSQDTVCIPHSDHQIRI